MILQALKEYYARLAAEDKVPLEGFQKKGISFVIVLKEDGSLAGIDDTREQQGRRKIGRSFNVPKVFEGSRTSNVKANLLWDKASYVFGIGKKTKDERLEKQKKEFLLTIKRYFPDKSNPGVDAVLEFLDKHQAEAKNHSLWEEVIDADTNIAFRLEGNTRLICQDESVRGALMNYDVGSEEGTCLITGEVAKLARLENPIKGLRFSGKAESHLVSFNAPSFWSYQKTSGENNKNAPISKAASFAYSAALNYLRQNPRQSLYIGDATAVFWAEKPHKIEEWFLDFFGEPPKGTSIQDTEAIRALYKAPETGAPPLEENYTKFCVLGLSPNASRISIRFWYQGTVGEVIKNIRQHFDDCMIGHAPFEPEYLSIFRMLVSTAVQGKADNIQPNLAGEVMKSILAGIPYPQTLLASSVRRCKAEREVTYPRASLIKAVLVRDSRYYRKTEKEVRMSLDRENANPGYLLGRLFAALERAQERANPGIDATIRDRFYGAASSTPVTVFPRLLKLKNHHISKLENRGEAVNLEKLIGEVMDAVNDFPALLSLPEQGRFAIGYYHQRQDFFKKKEQ